MVAVLPLQDLHLDLQGAGQAPGRHQSYQGGDAPPEAHPGLSVTDHFGKSDSENKLSSKLIETYANSPIGQSAEGGAIPLEFACTAEELEGVCFARCSRHLAL